jgi:hypothetical protein
MIPPLKNPDVPGIAGAMANGRRDIGVIAGTIDAANVAEADGLLDFPWG